MNEKTTTTAELPFTVLDGVYQLISMKEQVLKEVAFYDVLKLFTIHPTFFSFLQVDNMVTIVIEELYPMRMEHMYTVLKGYKVLLLDDSLHNAEALYDFLLPLYEAQIDIVQMNMITSVALLVSQEDLPRAEFILNRARDMSFGSCTETECSDSITDGCSMVDLSFITTNMSICTMSMTELAKCTNGILQAFFYRKNPVVWQSFSIVDSKVTLILDENVIFDGTFLPKWTVFLVSKGIVPVTESLVWKTMEVLQGFKVRYICMESVAGDFLLVEATAVNPLIEHLKNTCVISLTN